jgi:hypothetical protein
MADPKIGDEFKPGQDVKWSGIYKVVHDTQHAGEPRGHVRLRQEVPALQPLWQSRPFHSGPWRSAS